MASATFKRAGLAGFMVVATGAGGALLLAGCRSDDAPRTTASTESRSGQTDSADELVEFRHEEAGFALSYPKAWVRPRSSDPQVALLVAEKDPAANQGGSLSVRLTTLEAAVGKEQLGAARTVTDAIVASGDGVEVEAEPAKIDQGGLPGFHYLYTFHDAVTGQRGVHSHYFLFQEKTMVSLVLQAMPDNDFSRLARLFDRVADSFRVL